MSGGLRSERLEKRFVARPGEGGEVLLDQRHVYILPSRAGLLFLAVLAVLLVGSTNYGVSLGFVLTFLLGSLFLVTILHTWRNLARLTLAAGRPEGVFAGQEARFPLRLTAADGRPRRAVGVRCEGWEGMIAEVTAEAGGTIEVRQPAPRRGRLRLQRIRPFTDYPLGLFHAWSWLELDAVALVYPAPERGAPPLPAGPDRRGSGAAAGGGEEDFSGLRPYRPGDSLRHVAWKAVARGQGMPVKQFEGAAAAAAVWLDWSGLEGLGREARLSRLCRWVLEAEATGVRYGLRLPGRAIEPSLGEPHRRRCLEALARFDGGAD